MPATPSVHADPLSSRDHDEEHVSRDALEWTAEFDTCRVARRLSHLASIPTTLREQESTARDDRRGGRVEPVECRATCILVLRLDNRGV